MTDLLTGELADSHTDSIWLTVIDLLVDSLTHINSLIYWDCLIYWLTHWPNMTDLLIDTLWLVCNSYIH